MKALCWLKVHFNSFFFKHIGTLWWIPGLCQVGATPFFPYICPHNKNIVTNWQNDLWIEHDSLAISILYPKCARNNQKANSRKIDYNDTYLHRWMIAACLFSISRILTINISFSCFSWILISLLSLQKI